MKRGIGSILAVLLILALVVPALVGATTSTVADLAQAVAYWQEQAVLAAMERNSLREEVARLTAERDKLTQDRETLEAIVTRLQSERDAALANARVEAALREQGERDLAAAIETIKALEAAVTRLVGPRFGLILGATVDPGLREPAILAALQLTFP